MTKRTIITFYSFRGGVGRSMAMLNAGYLLARSGRRVLLVDFDLEAPGLTRLIDRQDILKPKPKPTTPKGVVDILHGYLFAKEKSILRAKNPYRSLDSYLVQLDIPQPKAPSGQPGTLHLMPAGRKRNYEKQLGELYMSSRQFKDIRKRFATRFREFLLKSGRFDYIFVDARTGFSDEGYIAAKFLCDHLVVLSGLNDQNIKGTADFLNKVAAWKDEGAGPQKLVLVASPVCEYEDDPKEKRYQNARETLKEVTGADIGFTLSLPYHPMLSLYEELVAIKWPDSGLGRAYGTLENVIRDINEDSASHWAKRTRDAFEHRKIDDFGAAIEQFAAIEPEQAASLARQTGIALTDSAGERAREILPIFDHLEKIDPDEPLYALQAARVTRNAGLGSKEVLKRLDKAAKIASKQENMPAMAVILAERANTLMKFDYAGARDAALESLSISESFKKEDLLINANLLVAHAERKLSNDTSAKAYAESALSIAKKLSQKEGILSALNLLAWLERARGEYAASRKKCKKSLKISRELRNRSFIEISIHSLAHLDYYQGDWNAARKQYEESLKISRELGKRENIATSLGSLANLDRHEGNFMRARKRLVEALKINRKLGDIEQASSLIYKMALLALSQGKYGTARKKFEESLKIDRKLGDIPGIGAGLHRIAMVDFLQGNLTAVRKDYEESLRIDREFSNWRGIARTLHSLGELERSMGNYSDARKRFDESLRIHHKIGLAIGVALLEARREAAHVQINNERPLRNLRSLVNRADSDPDQYVGARAFLLLGSIEMERFDFKKALVNLVKARDKAHRYGMRDLVAFSQAKQSICLSKLGQAKEAAEAAKAALAFFKAQNVRHPHAAEFKKLAAPPVKSQHKKKPKSPTTRPRKS